AMAGAGLGGLAAGYGLSPLPHFVLAAVVSAAATAAWSRRLLPAAVDAAPHGPMLAWPSRALLGLSALAYCMVLSEGAMADWTALYLGRVLSAHAGVAALGYACFSGAMMVGRALGDRLADRLGRVNLVRCGTLLGAAGLAAALLAPSAPLALAGFTVAGAGFSVVVPMVFAAAARRGRTPGLGMATVMTAGYAGLLTGPPAIGTLAAAFSLRAALLLPVALVLGAFALAGRTAPPAPTAAPDPCLNNNS
ncbi:MAG TPA: MFS transporter, partial [Solibacterales bacterium]|nr:MFS transporter [Bryobacterales bacterium]